MISYDLFEQLFMEVTKNYGVMVIDNTSKQKNNEPKSVFDKIFWYRAHSVPPPPFTIGSKQFVRFHNKSYDKEWNKKNEIIDISSLKKKKNSVKVIIKKVK
jgi:hypothetical protein